MTSGFQFSLNVNTQNSRIVEGNISNNDRKYYYVEPSVYWQLSPEWTLSGAYRHTNLKRDYESKSASANSLYLTLAYYPLKISISR